MQLETELKKNLSNLDTLAQAMLAKNNQTLRLPLDKVIYLINCLRMIKRLRKGLKPKSIPTGAKLGSGITASERAKLAMAAKFPFA